MTTGYAEYTTEKEFMEYLNDGKANSFNWVAPSGYSNRPYTTHLIKVVNPSTDIITLYECYGSSLYPQNQKPNAQISFFGVYLPKQNTVLTAGGYSYDTGVISEYCKELKVVYYYNLIGEIYDSIESTLINRRNSVNNSISYGELYKFYLENKGEVVKSVVKGEKYDKPTYISDRGRYFSDSTVFTHVQNFIMDAHATTISLCDKHEAEHGNSHVNKNLISIAHDNFRDEILMDAANGRAYTIAQLLKEHLSEAKSIWAVLKDGSKEKVEPVICQSSKYDRDTEITEHFWAIGRRYDNEVRVEDVELIKYGHRTFDINVEMHKHPETQLVKHKIYEPFTEILGAPVVYVKEGRLKDAERHKELYYYSMRHGENDWSEPERLEIGVMANYFGVLATSKPIKELTVTEENKNSWLMVMFDDLPDKEEVIFQILENRD